MGAALAALVLADLRLREYDKMPEPLRQGPRRALSAISRFLEKKRLGRHLPTRIHGVFDVANLQIAGPVAWGRRRAAPVRPHDRSGGPGSSSYATGNRCYDILKFSAESGGPFLGRSTFHPATHALVPVAQALIYAMTSTAWSHCRNPGP